MEQKVAKAQARSAPREKAVLRRKCGCGQHTGGGECEACRKKKLHRSPAGRVRPDVAPPVVHDVLRSSGRPLDPVARASLEPRFGRDFSSVRVHTDSSAASSASAVGALAYTAGRHVVFGPGQYRPHSPVGLSLLAHELSHVAQQDGLSVDRELRIGEPDSPEEKEAERIAERFGGPVRSGTMPPRLRRALQVARPAELIPTPSPSGPTPTNGEAVEQYLRTMAPQASVAVDRSTGRVSANEDFCRTRGQRFLHQFGRGALTGARIGAYALGVGALPGLIIGGLIGAVMGIVDAASGPASQAAASSTPTGSTCLCDFVTGGNLWTIEVNDSQHPRTGSPELRIIQVPSPNSQRIWGAATVSGRLQNMEPWLVLSHELCGHAWLIENKKGRDDEEGTVTGEDARHHRSVERENLIRREHGLEARGFRLKDPYCGESFSRERANPTDPAKFDFVVPEEQREMVRRGPHPAFADQTYLDDCQQLREQHLGERARRYRVEERIP